MQSPDSDEGSSCLDLEISALITKGYLAAEGSLV
jgi:hypothetical protein